VLLLDTLSPVIDASSYDANGAYAGPIALAIAVLCGVLTWRTTARWLVLAIMAVWLSMGYYAPIDLLRFLCQLPVLSAINLPIKYFNFFLFLSVCVLWGRLPSLLRRRMGAGLAAWTAAGVAAANLIPSGAFVRMIHSECYTQTPPAVKSNSFYHVRGLQMRRGSPRPAQAQMYFNFLRGVGTLDSLLPVRVSERAVPRLLVHPNSIEARNSRYRGEVYFKRPVNRAHLMLFTPNRIDIRVDAFAPGRLIVNQNFERCWHSNEGACACADGVLAIDLASTGTYVVTLRYEPRSFYLGAAISVATLVSMLLLLGPWRRCWIARRMHGGGPSVAVRIPGTAGVWPVVGVGACVWIASTALGVLWPQTVGRKWHAEDAVAAGKAALDLGQLDHAISLFREALAVRPGDSLTRIRLGRALLKLGALRVAIVELRQADRAPGAQAAANATLATAFGALGRRKEAIDACNRSLRADPYQPSVWAYLSAMYAVARERQLALSAAKRAVELGFTDGAAWFSRPEFGTLRADPAFMKLAAGAKS